MTHFNRTIGNLHSLMTTFFPLPARISIVSRFAVLAFGAALFGGYRIYAPEILTPRTEYAFQAIFTIVLLYTVGLTIALVRSDTLLKEMDFSRKASINLTDCIMTAFDTLLLMSGILFLGGHDGYVIIILFLTPIAAGFQFKKFKIDYFTITIPSIYLLSILYDCLIIGDPFNSEMALFTAIILSFSVFLSRIIFSIRFEHYKNLQTQIEESGTLNRRLESVRKLLTREIENNSREIEANYLGFLETIVLIMEERDPMAFGSSRNTVELAVKIAGIMKQYEAADILQTAGVIHDLGNIGIPDRLFNSENDLSEEERDFMRSHVRISVEILSTIDYFEKFIPMCRYHHEHFDGSGYPDGLRGENIPLESRIIAVADSYTALTSERYHRRAYGRTEALRIIEESSGKNYDPQVVESLREILRNECN